MADSTVSTKEMAANLAEALVTGISNSWVTVKVELKRPNED